MSTGRKSSSLLNEEMKLKYFKKIQIIKDNSLNDSIDEA